VAVEVGVVPGCVTGAGGVPRLGAADAPANWADPSFDTAGRQLAIDIWDGKQSDIWIYDLQQGGTSRLTLDSADDFKPVWTPDGTRIAFTSSREGGFNVFWQRVDGTGAVQRLTDRGDPSAATSWHPTGKFLAVNRLSPQTSFDVVVVPVEGDEASGWNAGPSATVLNTPAVEIEGVFSPDGRWLAYTSNESGRFEVYVRPFPGSGGPWQISNGGGTLPTWSRTRSELLYGALDQRIMAVTYTTAGGAFRPGPPRVWSEGRFEMLGPVINRHFDLHPDGKRVAMAKVPEAGASNADKIVFAFNFFDELRRVVPLSKSGEN
jgi:serine/threonine-protein kinase